MRTYIRDLTSGAAYFLTRNLKDRQSGLLIRHMDQLRIAYRKTQQYRPFELNAMVVLPDHLHLLMTLPDGDADYASRVSYLKSQFSRQIPLGESISASREKKGERAIWQRRYWEHRIRDDLDYQRHMDYIHFNPVKHGYAESSAAWPYSTFRRYVEWGVYAPDWAMSGDWEGVGELGE